MDDLTTSILGSVRKLLGSDNYFDIDLIIHINSAFSELQQLGVGPEEGFAIEDESTEWEEYTNDKKIMNMVKTYMVLKVRLAFDISTASSYMIETWKQECQRLEWRLQVACDRS